MRLVLLEHPREPSAFHFNDIANTPLWACLMSGYAGACLREAGFEVTIVDAARWSFADTIRYLVRVPMDLLAVHAVYFWERTDALMEMLSALKSEGLEAPICLFGFFPTLTWRDILDSLPAVDYVLVGEPEESIVELARRLQGGDAPRFPGLASRVHGKAELPGLRPPIEPLERLPYPLRPSLESEQTISLLASRGCYNGCAFCLVPTLNGGRAAWRARSPKDVATEIADLVASGKRDFYFVDPNFIGQGSAGKEHAMELAGLLVDLGITFGMETRAMDINGPLMKSLVNAGLRTLLIGIESGSPRVLKRLDKNISVAQNERAIAMVRDAGLEPEIGFIMFEPESTLDDITENLRFLHRNRLLDRLSRTANLLYHSQIAFKGTPGYWRALTRGKLAPEGLFGFEGRLLYDDVRVGWLAELMRPISHYALKEMDRNQSVIHWRTEGAGGVAFQAVNACLVELFEKLLATASGFLSEPGRSVTATVLAESLKKLQETLAEARGEGNH